jgi:4-hydroxy-3-methylbut-2-enyl diphosphate reductase
MMEVQTATLGWCIGIDRAYRLMNKQASVEDRPPLYAAHHAQQPATNADMDTLHRIERGDPQLLERYPALQHVQVLHDLSVVPTNATLMLGFHGLERDTITGLQERGIVVQDYKCPFIARLDNTVDRLVEEGFDILIMGKSQNHHCRYARAAAEKRQRQCIILETLEDVETVPTDTAARWALVGQVTGNTLLWQEIVEQVQQRGLQAHVVQTICSDSHQRQEQAMGLARQTDCCVIVDDGGGASQSLFEVLSTMTTRVYRLRWRDDGSWQAALDPAWLTGIQSVAVVGGILVPQWALDAVATHLRNLG